MYLSLTVQTIHVGLFNDGARLEAKPFVKYVDNVIGPCANGKKQRQLKLVCRILATG